MSRVLWVALVLTALRLAAKEAVSIDLVLKPIDGRSIQYSPDRLHFSHVKSDETGAQLCFDGKALKPPRRDLTNRVSISHDNRRLAAVVDRAEGDDNKNAVAVFDLKSTAADGGLKVTPFYDAIRSTVFSADAGRMAFVATKNYRECVVVDGKDGPFFTTIVDRAPNGGPPTLAFSGDGKHVMYVGVKENKHHLVVDGEATEAVFKHWPRICSDGKVVYTALLPDEKVALVTNGKPGQSFDAIQSLLLSSDGKRVVCLAQEKPAGAAPKTHLVVNDKIEKTYGAETVSGLQLSADGSAHGYLLLNDKGVRVVVNGRETKAAGHNAPSGFALSPNGRRSAYFAARGDKRFAVIDGKPEKDYDNVSGRHVDSVACVVFSADSKRYAYVAMSGGEMRVVCDGAELKSFPQIREDSLTFSTDGSHLLYVASAPAGDVLAVDKVETPIATGAGTVVHALATGPNAYHFFWQANSTGIVHDATVTVK